MQAASIVDDILQSISVTGTVTTHGGLQSISDLVSFGSTFTSFSATGTVTNIVILYPSKFLPCICDLSIYVYLSYDWFCLTLEYCDPLDGHLEFPSLDYLPLFPLTIIVVGSAFLASSLYVIRFHCNMKDRDQ